MNFIKTRLFQKEKMIFWRIIKLMLYIERKISVKFITKPIIDNFFFNFKIRPSSILIGDWIEMYKEIIFFFFYFGPYKDEILAPSLEIIPIGKGWL